MKKFILFLLLLGSMSVSFAQTQQGRVKTRGRLNSDGTVTHGKGIPGATVTLGNGSAQISGDNGTFSFAVSQGTYSLRDVQKQNYQLCDRDLLARSRKYSTDILEIAMQTPDEALEDRLESEEKIRATLTEQLNKQKAELRHLKEEQIITQQEYNKKLQKLYDDLNNNEKFISEMAERYSTMDYDLLDEFNKKVTNCILNGKLTEADSLLRSKGSIENRISKIYEIKEANTIEKEKLNSRITRLQNSELYVQEEIEDIARDCYSHFEIFWLKHKMDSAAYYIEQRAHLDSLNFDYVWECGSFFLNEGNYVKARPYLEQVGRNPTLPKDYIALSLNDLSLCYTYMGDTELGIKTLKMSYDIRMNLLQEDPAKYKCSAALANSNYGATISMSDTTVIADEYFLRAISLYTDLSKCIPLFEVCLANTEENYGYYLLNKHMKEESYTYSKKSLDRRLLYAEKYPDVYNTTNNVTQSDILNIIQKERWTHDDIEITKECLLILASAARDNKEHIPSTARQLSYSLFGKSQWNDAAKMINLASRVQKELYLDKPYKHAYSTIGTLLDRIYLLSQNAEQIDSLIDDGLYILDIVNSDKPYYQDDDYDFFAIHKATLFLGFAFKEKDKVKSKDYYMKALDNMSHCKNIPSINYNDDYVFILRQLAENYFALNQESISVDYLNKALDYAEKEKLIDFELSIRFDLTNLCMGRNDFETAKHHLRIIIPALEKNIEAPPSNIALLYFYLGGCEKMTNETKLSQQHLKKSLTIFNELNKSEEYQEVINQIISLLDQFPSDSDN